MVGEKFQQNCQKCERLFGATHSLTRPTKGCSWDGAGGVYMMDSIGCGWMG